MFLTKKYVVLVFLWMDYLWEQYLCAREYKRISLMKVPPDELRAILPKSNFNYKKSMAIQEKNYRFVRDLLTILTTTAILHFNILPSLWYFSLELFDVEDNSIHSAIWYLSLTLLTATINFPLTLYDIFILQANNGKQADLLAFKTFKLFLSSLVFIFMFSIFVEYIFDKGHYFVALLYSVLSFMIYIVGTHFPYMAPSKYRTIKPLKDEELKEKFFNLAKQLKFPLKEVLLEQSIKKVAKKNLYFYGNLSAKSLVITDGLIIKDTGCSHDEILAYFLLEFFRWKYNHTSKFILGMEFNLFLTFTAFFLLLHDNTLLTNFGFEAKPNLILAYVILKYVMVLCNTLLSFIFIQISRKLTKTADEFVVRFGKGEALIGALLKIESDAFNFPVCDELYSKWHYEKLPLYERIRKIKLGCEAYS